MTLDTAWNGATKEESCIVGNNCTLRSATSQTQKISVMLGEKLDTT